MRGVLKQNFLLLECHDFLTRWLYGSVMHVFKNFERKTFRLGACLQDTHFLGAINQKALILFSFNSLIFISATI